MAERDDLLAVMIATTTADYREADLGSTDPGACRAMDQQFGAAVQLNPFCARWITNLKDDLFLVVGAGISETSFS